MTLDFIQATAHGLSRLGPVDRQRFLDGFNETIPSVREQPWRAFEAYRQRGLLVELIAEELEREP